MEGATVGGCLDNRAKEVGDGAKAEAGGQGHGSQGEHWPRGGRGVAARRIGHGGSGATDGASGAANGARWKEQIGGSSEDGELGI